MKRLGFLCIHQLGAQFTVIATGLLIALLTLLDAATEYVPEFVDDT